MEAILLILAGVRVFPCHETTLLIAAREPTVWFPTKRLHLCWQGSYLSDEELNLRRLCETHLPVVERVVCQTFAHWYSHKNLLKLVVGRMRKRVMASMSAATTLRGQGNPPLSLQISHDNISHDNSTGVLPNATTPVVVHVGHDVTIVPLLYALNSWSGSHPWPKYAAAVRFELYQDVTNGGDDGQYYVHVSYAEGFDELSQNDEGEHFVPNFVALHGYVYVRFIFHGCIVVQQLPINSRLPFASPTVYTFARCDFDCRTLC